MFLAQGFAINCLHQRRGVENRVLNFQQRDFPRITWWWRIPANVLPRAAASTEEYDGANFPNCPKHTSVLNMIEWRWNLRPLTVRDSQANNLAEVLDFSRTNLSAPRFAVPPGPFGGPCAAVTPETVENSQAALQMAADFGFPVQQ
jgi:hypothetical protein